MLAKYKYYFIGGFILLIVIFKNIPSNCKGNIDYESGYEKGRVGRLTGGYGDCKSFVNGFNNETGTNTYKVTDCFCDGFDDGLNGKESKF